MKNSPQRLLRLAKLGLREKGYRGLGDSLDLNLKTCRALETELWSLEPNLRAKLADTKEPWSADSKVAAYVQCLCRERSIPLEAIDGMPGPKTREAAQTLEIVMTVPAMLRFSQQVLRGDFSSEEEIVKHWSEPGGSDDLNELLDLVPRTSDAIEAAVREEWLPRNWSVRKQLVGFVQLLCRQAGFKEVGEVDGNIGWRTLSAFDRLSRRFTRGPRIGLALSGGGFRSAIFHLGVIRRLEELGLMSQVSVISSVSGGSIIAAYYLIEMEQRLRARKPNPAEHLRGTKERLRKARRDVRKIEEEVRKTEEEIRKAVQATGKSKEAVGSSVAPPKTEEDLREARARLRRAEEEELPRALATLRQARLDLPKAHQLLCRVRVKICQEIADDFFRATDRNLRVRALIFSPFYHPIAALKMLRPNYNRADLIQAEYDRWFYKKNTLDQLPYVSPAGGSRQAGPLGPKLVINTTSLLTGRRVTFTRESISGIRELSRVDTNVLPLSRIVGASAGVPGLFPPTPVSGDLLVDGGVSDNQGLEALWEEGCDALLVSDASGQMEQLHKLKAKAVAVLGRTNSIFQSGIRSQLIHRLLQWRERGAYLREFAFVHLHQNLKGDSEARWRVPSEYIAALARIRTDLDQFSHVERESLMFHGYTLINSRLRRSCPRLWKMACRSAGGKGGEVADLHVPPLYAPNQSRQAAPGDGEGVESADKRAARARQEDLQRRSEIKRILAAGQHPLLIKRTIARDGVKAGLVVALAWLLPVALFLGFGFPELESIVFEKLKPLSDLGPLTGWLGGLLPEMVSARLPLLADHLSSPISFRGLLAVTLFAASTYVLLFFTYSAIRWLSGRWDRRTYERLTGSNPDDSEQARWVPAASIAASDQLTPGSEEPRG